MLSTNLFCLPFLSVFSVLTVLLILKILNLFVIFTLISSSLLVLWLSWNLMSVWRKLVPKELISTSGKVVLVTGCDHGFGFMTAQALHKLGFTVFACCLSDKSAGTQALRGMNVKTLQMNVTNEEEIKNSRIEVENYLKETKSQLWAIVNNAGLFTSGLIEWGDLTDLTKVLDVNVVGLVKVTRYFLPLIRRSKGRVINIASCSGRFTTPPLAYYSMSKHSVIAFSDALRREMFVWKVRVITIEPMHYMTPMSNEDTIREALFNLWERTPPEVKSDYGENFFHCLKDKVTSTSRTARPQTSDVVKAVMDAAANVSPKTRYACCDVPFSIMWWCMEILPNEIVDKAFNLMSFFMVKPRGLDNGF